MFNETHPHFYDEQLRRYLVQFMAIFAGIQVQVGKTGERDTRLVRIPIRNSSADRVVTWIKGGHTQNKPIRVPMFSVEVSDIALDPTLRKGVGQIRRNVVTPVGGSFPSDTSVVEQRMPVPYSMTIALHLWASNQDQHYQMLEQILVIFDPMLQLQTSDDGIDWKQITSVELMSCQLGENVPMGTDRRLIQTTLEFRIPVYLSIPAQTHKRIVQDIMIRIGAINSAMDSPDEIIAELDRQGIEYDHVASIDEIPPS